MKSENKIQSELMSICKDHENIAWIDRANSGKVKTRGGWLQLHQIGTSDLIGIKTTVITPDMVGSTIGQFIGIEIKTPDAFYSKKHSMSEEQIDFMNMVNSNGGIAGCCCDEETLQNILERTEDEQ